MKMYDKTDDMLDWLLSADVQSTEALGYDDYIKLLRGVVGYNLNLVGCDLAEVSPQFDSAEITSPLAANLLFERICLFCFC
jgi:arginase family enzyme